MNENEIIEKRKKDLRDFLKLMDDQAENRPEGYILTKGTVFVGRQSSKSIKELYFEPKKVQFSAIINTEAIKIF
jgi:hypothetical protein